MNSLKPSVVILGGNHKAFSRTGGHNGKIDHFHCQEQALDKACQLYRRAMDEADLPVHLYTTIDHIGGKRVLTGKRNNGPILAPSELVEGIKGPLLRVLEAHGVSPDNLKVIPEKTLVEHSIVLHRNDVLNGFGICSAFKEGCRPVCRGLAGAYIDFAARDALKSGPVGFVDFFIETGEGIAVASPQIFTSGASIVRHGLVERESFPNWTSGAQIRGFHVTTEGIVKHIS